MDGEAWQTTVHGVAKSQTRLSNFIFTFSLVKVSSGFPYSVILIPPLNVQ